MQRKLRKIWVANRWLMRRFGFALDAVNHSNTALFRSNGGIVDGWLLPAE